MQFFEEPGLTRSELPTRVSPSPSNDVRESKQNHALVILERLFVLIQD